MSDSIEKLYPEGKAVKIADKEFKIKPFVLRDRTKVVRMIADVIKEVVSNSPNAKTDNLSALSGEIIRVAGDKIIDVYNMVIPDQAEWLLDNMKMVDEVNVIETILEVNSFSFLVEKLKGLGKEGKKATA